MKMKMNRQEVWNVFVWFIVGWGGVKLGEWLFPGMGAGVVQAFFLGAFIMFLGLSMLGSWKQQQIIVQNDRAKLQWDQDREAEIEQQATIDQEIIEKLKQEHTLTGKQQDDRLHALEAALKHLRKQ